MLYLFGARKLSWNGLVQDEIGGVSQKQDCIFDRACIGRGAHGAIHRGKYYLHYPRQRDRVLDVAVKETDADDAELANLLELQDEAEIVHLFNYSRCSHYAGLVHKHLFVIELCEGGDLLDHVLARPLTTEEALSVIHWLARAVHKCHQHGIIHTDIKLDNIGVVKRGSLKELRLLDFGNSKRIADAPFDSKELRGSPHYIAPELAQKKRFSKPAQLFALDMWSAGIVAYALLENEFFVNSSLSFKRTKDPRAHHLVQNLLCHAATRWTAKQCLDFFET